MKTIRKNHYPDLDWDEVEKLLRNGLTKTALSRKLGVNTDITQEIIEREIGSYEVDKDATMQLEYDEYRRFLEIEEALKSGELEYWVFHRICTKEIGISEGALKRYMSKTSLKSSANVSGSLYKKGDRVIESMDDYRNRGNNYDAELKILKSIDLPVVWLEGHGADMICDNSVVEIKTTLTRNNLYKAILQTMKAEKNMKNYYEIKYKSIYVLNISDDVEKYAKNYCNTFGISVYQLKNGEMKNIIG